MDIKKIISESISKNPTGLNQAFENAIMERIALALEKKKLDKVDPEQLKGDFEDREDKDINNDGKVDDSDKYLHNRRKTIMKAMKKESVGLDEVLAKDYSGMLGVFKKDVERAEEAKKKGDNKKMEMHLSNARNRLMGMKSTDTAKLKNTDHYDRYKNLKESVELKEAKIGDIVSYGTKIGGKIKIKKAKVVSVRPNGKIELDTSAILDMSDRVSKKSDIEMHHDFVFESTELDEAKNTLVARYMNKDGSNVLYFEIWEKPNGNLYSKISNQRGFNIAASAIDLRSSHADAKRNVERAVMFYDQDGDSGALKHLNSLLPGWKKVPIQETVESNDLEEAFNLDVGAKVAMKDNKGKTIYGKVIDKEKVMGEPGVEVKWDSGVKGRFKMSAFAGLSMDRKADYIISEEVDHSRYMRSHGKKARGRGMWMFTTKDMGEPSEDEMVTVSGSLSAAAKEAAKKLGTKRVYVMEEVELNEDVHNDLNDAIIDFQRKLMRMNKLDAAIAKEVKMLDKMLDDLRTGSLFKIRPGR